MLFSKTTVVGSGLSLLSRGLLSRFTAPAQILFCGAGLPRIQSESGRPLHPLKALKRISEAPRCFDVTVRKGNLAFLCGFI